MSSFNWETFCKEKEQGEGTEKPKVWGEGASANRI